MRLLVTMLSGALLISCSPVDEVSLPGDTAAMVAATPTSVGASTSRGPIPVMAELTNFPAPQGSDVVAMATLQSGPMGSGENYVEVWAAPPLVEAAGLAGYLTLIDPLPAPFEDADLLDFSRSSDGLGALHWTAGTLAGGVRCVLAFRRSEMIRPGSVAVMRNCNKASVESLLRPLRAS